ncbi:MAG: hypothetical protein FWF42_00465 [Streptococcaceae bacterium]|nr:hypothetical protein [Streptococcaceae bacterium]MCL2681224.1 hypothetical protein [Streptococcaceae bacterium]MCL2858143.1 hypothetical protein [Streptococcaceae bacterium]
MGKYQLDGKGQNSVQKFHEKHSSGQSDKRSRVEELKKSYLEKKKNKPEKKG